MDREDQSHGNKQGGGRSGADDKKIYRDFERFGLANTAAALDTIDFIQSNLSETKKKRDHLQAFQEAVTLKKEDFLGPAADPWQSESNSYGPVPSDSARKKSSEPRWNTGTYDFNKKYKYQRDRLDEMMTVAMEEQAPKEHEERSQLASFQGKMEENQQSVSRILGSRESIMEEYRGYKQQSRCSEIGEMARYELDSEKSEDEKAEEGRLQTRESGLYSKVSSKLRREAVKAQLQRGTRPQVADNSESSLPSGQQRSIAKARLLDSETARHDQKVMAMRAKQDRELDELDQIFGDTESAGSAGDQKGPTVPRYGPSRVTDQAQDAVTHVLGERPAERAKTNWLTSKDGMTAEEWVEGMKRSIEIQQKADQSNAQGLTGASRHASSKDNQASSKRRMETDLKKWEGTGLEDMAKQAHEAGDAEGRAYKNPIEKKKSKKKDKRAAKKKKDGQSAMASLEDKTQIIFAGEPLATTVSDKDSAQASLFAKSTPINLNDLQQKQTQRIYNLGGPVLINQNWEFYSGHPPVGSAGDAEDVARRQRSTMAATSAMMQNTDYQRMKEAAKNQIVTASKFYTLKENQSLPCHFNMNRDRANHNRAGLGSVGKDLPRVYNQGALYSSNGGSDIADATFQGPGRRTLPGGATGASRGNQAKGTGRGTTTNETSIPSVKEWFEQLTLAERILCVTTVDPNITASINNMYKQLKTVHQKGDRGKFRLKTSTQSFNIQVTDLTQKQRGTGGEGETHGGCSWSMVMCNQNAYPSNAEVKAAERELLEYIRVTDTAQMHDTLTVREELMKDPEAFYSLAERIVGSNFLRGRHDVEWIEEKCAFESKAPLWLEMDQPNSLAAWLLYYLERAMCIQYDCNIYGRFLTCKDKKKDGVFLSADKQLIRDEMRPSWRSFCADATKEAGSQEMQQFLQMLRTQALQKCCGAAQEKGSKTSASKSNQVNIFHGGLSLHNDSPAEQELEQDAAFSEQRHVAILVEEYAERVKGYIQNHASDSPRANRSRLDLSEICMDQLAHSSAIESPNRSHAEVAKTYNFHCQIQRAPQTTMALAHAGSRHPFEPDDSIQMNEMTVARLHMEMKLERLMTETFKEFRNQRLLQGFHSQNKKALKKKLKKKLQREQEEERERQRQEEQKRVEEEKERKRKQREGAGEEDGHIKVNNSAAVQLLLGQDSLAREAGYEHGKAKRIADAAKAPAPNPPRETPGGKQKMSKGNQHKDRGPSPSLPGTEPQQVDTQVDPFNYFQVLAHQKQSAHAQVPSSAEAASRKSQESQGRSNRQRRPVPIGAAAAPGGSSHCGTTKTISTCDESKQVEQSSLAAAAHATLQDDLDSVMSNQEFLTRQRQHQRREGQAIGPIAAGEDGDKLPHVHHHYNQGNALFKTKHWQRKDNTKAVNVLDEIIGELMSESSSAQGRSGAHQRNASKFQVIDLAIKGNKMHAHESHLATDQECSEESADQSSMSSRKETNRIITFKKPHVRRVVPKPRPRSSSSSSGESGQSATDSDQDLLPDVYAKFDPQPHDNDSSDYGAEEPHDEVDILNTVEDEEPDAESLADNSSMAYEKSIGDPSLLTSSAFKKQYAKISDKKSIQTAYPKIEGQLVGLDQQRGQGSKRQGTRKKAKKNKIDFYQHDKAGESCEEDDDQVPQPRIVKLRAMKIPTIPTLTMQLVELESEELTCKGEVKANAQPPGKQKNKKTKKQRQLEYQNHRNAMAEQAPVQAKQIEIIKPVKEPQPPSKKGKAGEQAKDKQGNDGAAPNEKKKKKKAPEQLEAMNSFISKLQGESTAVDEANKGAAGAAREGSSAAQKKAKKAAHLLQEEPVAVPAERTKRVLQGTTMGPPKTQQAASKAESSSQNQAQTKLQARQSTAKHQEGSLLKNHDMQEEFKKQLIQAQQKLDESQKREEANRKASERDKKGEKNSLIAPNTLKSRQIEQNSQPQNQGNKKQEEEKRSSPERPVVGEQVPAPFNMNSQEFRLQKKSSLMQTQQEHKAKRKDEELDAAASPRKKFKSLQEALEYNQNTAQEATISTQAAKGKKSAKNQANKNAYPELQISENKDMLKPAKSVTSGRSAIGAKDQASDKSQSSQPKKKKKRKNKDSKAEPPMNLQLQQSWIDPATGETVYMDMAGNAVGPLAGGYGPLPNSGLAPGQMQGPFGADGLDGQPMPHDTFVDQQSTALQLQQQLQKMTLQMQQIGGAQPFSPFNAAAQQPGHLMGGPPGQSMMMPPQMGGMGAPNISHQVQELLFKIQEQYMAHQQMQIAEIQRRQQEEEELQMMEDCDPCPEIDEVRYDQFFEELGEEMRAKVKEIDMLKDSVRKERQGFISMVETIVKDTFSNRYGNGYVGIKIFGSMATELAIETSDVDLVVTGINAAQLHGLGSGSKEPLTPKEHVLKIMQKLYDNLIGLKSTGQIQKIKFIPGATVPIIKLVADLQAINQHQTERAVAAARKEWEERHDQAAGSKSGKAKGDTTKWEDVSLRDLGIEPHEIEPSMRYLQVDISIDEQSDQMEGKRQFGSQMGASGNLSASSGIHTDSQLTSGLGLPPGILPSRAHSGIDTIYHIQELVRARKDLRPIVMIIKKIFDQTFLSMPYCGGLSSFSLVLMVSAYLKRFDEKNTESLSRNLSGFFHFYGSGFKPHLHYLNGDNIEFEENERPFPDPFIVLDPLDPSNNVGHSTFRIKDIQRALVQAFKIIKTSCEEYQQLDPAVYGPPHATKSWALPRNVLDRLLTEIREHHYQQNAWTDDDL